jgi:hypothetical protein
VPPRVQVAAQAPEWLLQQWVPIDWFKRDARRIEESRLSLKKEEQEAFLEQVGQDGSQLLSRLYQEDAPALLAHLPQVQILRQMWIQHYFWEEGPLRLRNKDMLPPAHLPLRSLMRPARSYWEERRFFLVRVESASLGNV